MYITRFFFSFLLFPLGGMIWSVEMLCLFLIIFCTYKKISAFNRYSIFMYLAVRVVTGFNSFIYTTFWEIVVQCSPVHQLFIEINIEIKQIWIHMLSDCLDTVDIKIEFEFSYLRAHSRYCFGIYLMSLLMIIIPHIFLIFFLMIILLE